MTRKILLIYTGGTIGMKQDPSTLSLKPFNFNQILEEVPELKKFGYKIDTYSFDPLIDSSDVTPEFWVELALLVKQKYNSYDGFVVLHGTDTMSYTASALSFMFTNLSKPVILTGSQLPIGVLRTDGKENLISSIEIAAAANDRGEPMVPEVAIYFESQLYRGNRTTKNSAENFRAFKSFNYSTLADVGIHIKYNTKNIIYPLTPNGNLEVSTNLETNVAILKIHPGITGIVMDSVLNNSNVKGVILETFGSGNAPTSDWFIERLKRGIRRGLIIVNVTQCQAGSVDMDAYETGRRLKEIGVVSGYDITTEAALAKLFYLLGKGYDNERVKDMFKTNLRGEISFN